MSNALAYLADIGQLTEESSSNKRRELLTAATDVFLVSLSDQTESDLQMFGDVMERLAYELEVEARAQLSEKVCDAESVAHHLIVRLANDEIEVARPVLERSVVLRDDDLIDIIRNRYKDHPQDHLHSIAGRRAVSGNVSDELVDHGNDHTVTRLTINEGATISTESFLKIADRAEQNTDLVDALGKRNDVPATVLGKIKDIVSDRITPELMGSHPNLNESFVNDLIDRCAEEIDLDYCQESIANFDKLHKTDRLNETVIASLARERKLPDLVHCLGLLTGLDNWSVSQCVMKAELPALAILCKSQKFNSSTFLALADIRREENDLPANALVKMARDYDALTNETAERIMRYLKVRLKLRAEQVETEELDDASSA